MEAVQPNPIELEPELIPPSAGKNESAKYHILDTPELRAKYLTLTDGLIQKLTENKTDVAIYLDKSARPVAWLVNELWDDLAPRDAEGEIPPRPQTKFLNIDREQWGAVVGRSEDLGGIDIRRLPAARLQELRDTYAPIKGQSKSGDKSLLTDKNVLVVDEVSVSGDTLNMSRAILESAFPDAASIEGAYWMSGNVKTEPRTGVRKNTELPVWYSDTRVTGRLVGNRDTSKSARSNSSRQRKGMYWLSTGFRGFRDMDGLQLKEEVKSLSEDLKAHRMLYRPASGWGDAEFDARMLRINGITTSEYAALIKANPDDIASQIKFFAEQKAHEKKRTQTAKELGKTSINQISSHTI